MRNLKIGDVVQLKGQNVPMTIADIYRDGTVECFWFDIKARLRRELFRSDILEFVDEKR